MFVQSTHYVNIRPRDFERFLLEFEEFQKKKDIQLLIKNMGIPKALRIHIVRIYFASPSIPLGDFCVEMLNLDIFLEKKGYTMKGKTGVEEVVV